MKLCFICHEYPPGPHGGIGSVTQTIARALAGTGHGVRVVGVYNADYPAPDYEVDHGVCVTRLRWPARRFAAPTVRRGLFRLVAEWVKQGLVDLVEVPDYQGWAAGWRPLPVPVVARLNGSSAYFAAEMGARVGRLAYHVERASLKRADFVASSSLYTATRTRQLFRLPVSTTTLLHNPVDVPDTPAVSGHRRSSNQVVFSGTLTEKKGIYSLMRAWPQVLMRRPDARLRVLGKDTPTAAGGSTKAALLAALPQSAAASVEFRGHVARAELLDALQTAAVAVFPSYAEAFALAPLEAMACGCPTIYSRRGSGPELVNHGVDGWLTEPDDVEHIAATILRALEDPESSRRIGAAGRALVADRFDIKVLLPRNVEFFEHCVSTFGNGPCTIQH